VSFIVNVFHNQEPTREMTELPAISEAYTSSLKLSCDGLTTRPIWQLSWFLTCGMRAYTKKYETFWTIFSSALKKLNRLFTKCSVISTSHGKLFFIIFSYYYCCLCCDYSYCFPSSSYSSSSSSSSSISFFLIFKILRFFVYCSYQYLIFYYILHFSYFSPYCAAQCIQCNIVH
jgi:hypothetical protein